MQIKLYLLGISIISLIYISCQGDLPKEAIATGLIDNNIRTSDSTPIDTIPIVTKTAEIDTDFFNIQLNSSERYSTIKTKVKNKQNDFRNIYFNLDTEEEKDSLIQAAGEYITEVLVNEIIPHWYGTPWSFSGYTATPNNGETGCSYFVSTTLLHAGFPLNRYKLAQQGPQSEAKSLQLDSIHIVENSDMDVVIYQYMEENFDEGIFFVGLEHSHVGYLLYRNEQLFFIQSSFGDPAEVVIEKIEFSDIFQGYYTYAIAEISTNKKLMEHWVKLIDIPIIKGKE